MTNAENGLKLINDIYDKTLQKIVLLKQLEIYFRAEEVGVKHNEIKGIVPDNYKVSRLRYPNEDIAVGVIVEGGEKIFFKTPVYRVKSIKDIKLNAPEELNMKLLRRKI